MKLCREQNVIKFAADDLEILFGPPLETVKVKPNGKEDPMAAKRAHYANMLGRETLSDAELMRLP